MLQELDHDLLSQDVLPWQVEKEEEGAHGCTNSISVVYDNMNMWTDYSAR